MDGARVSQSSHPGARTTDDRILDANFPRLLVIDHTLSGNGTATGELKRSLFRNWPADQLLQLYNPKPRVIGVDGLRSCRGFDPSNLSREDAVAVAVGFAPQAILYRPVPNQSELHQTALEIIERLRVPHIIWMMDDWPTVQQLDKGNAFAPLDRDLRRLLNDAKLRLSICDSMSDAFRSRYGVPFKAYANGIDPDDWNFPPRTAERKPLLIRYAGSLAENMTLDSVLRIAKAVEELNAEGMPITFEIKTSPYWSQLVGSRFRPFKFTVIRDALLSEADYRKWLAASDVNTIAYNFDDRSLAYVKYSLANKLPECLASGAALLVHGPEGLPTVDYVKARQCGSIASANDLESLKRAIRDLVSKPTRDALVARAQDAVINDHDVRKLREGLRIDIEAIADPVANASETERAFTAAYPPAAEARVDETEVVSTLFDPNDEKHRVMLDVGAHVGSSARYFASKGWSVHCFEPDPSNRKALVSRFGSNPNVTIDPRAVGEAPAVGRAFFTSDESSGISSLLPFRETHKEAARVDVTTVAEIIRDRGLEKIDFLKIDVEGWDFSVLKGVPWDTLQPSIIECEFEDAKTEKMGFTYRDIADYLVERGYTVYVSEWHPIVRYGVAHKWYRLKLYPCGLANPKGWGNLLAFREDPGATKLANAFETCLKVREPSGSFGPTVKSRVKEKLMDRFGSVRRRAGQLLRTRYPNYYGRALDLESALLNRPFLVAVVALAFIGWIVAIALSGTSLWQALILQAPVIMLVSYLFWRVRSVDDAVNANAHSIRTVSAQVDAAKGEIATLDRSLKHISNETRLTSTGDAGPDASD